MIVLYLRIALALALPAILAIGFSCLTWRSLGRPWLFVVLATIFFYFLYYLMIVHFPIFFWEYGDPVGSFMMGEWIARFPAFMVRFSVFEIVLLIVARRAFRKAV